MSNLVKTMNATIVTGEYTNAQGEQKKSYLTIGTLFVYDDGGMSMKLDALPLGTGNISFYDKKPKTGTAPQGQGQPAYGQPPAQAPQGQPAYGGQTPPAHNNPPVEYYDAQGQPLPQR